MRPFKLMAIASLTALAIVASCATDDAGLAPCSADGRCLAGFRCEEGFCVECGAAECTSQSLDGVGPEGATVCGSDDVCLKIPASALSEFVDVRISLASPNVDIDGLVLLSRVYSLAPAGQTLTTAATLEIPISTDTPVSSIAVYGSATESGPWSRLPGSATSITATAQVTALQFVVAATTP